MDFLGGSASKESACDEGDLGSIPGSGRSPGEGKGYSLQYPGLENEVAKSQTRLRDYHFHTCTRTHAHTHSHIYIYIYIYIYVYIYSVCSLFAFFLFLRLLGLPSNRSHLPCPWFIFCFKDVLALVTSTVPSKALVPSLTIFS